MGGRKEIDGRGMMSWDWFEIWANPKKPNPPDFWSIAVLWSRASFLESSPFTLVTPAFDASDSFNYLWHPGDSCLSFLSESTEASSCPTYPVFPCSLTFPLSSLDNSHPTSPTIPIVPLKQLTLSIHRSRIGLHSPLKVS